MQTASRGASFCWTGKALSMINFRHHISFSYWVPLDKFGQKNINEHLQFHVEQPLTIAPMIFPSLSGAPGPTFHGFQNLHMLCLARQKMPRQILQKQGWASNSEIHTMFSLQLTRMLGIGQFVLCMLHSCRSLSEGQESAQFLAGDQLPEQVVGSLFAKTTVSGLVGLVNLSPYDCWLESSAMKWGRKTCGETIIASLSLSKNLMVSSYCERSLALQLMQD